MIGELNFYGVYLPALFLISLISLTGTVLLRAVLRRVGFYRIVWHPALFDVAVFVIALGIALFLTASWTFS